MKQKILDILEQNRGKSISGSQIAKILNCSRTAIWKHINQLKHEGFDIQSTTNKGYCLNIFDDAFSESAIKKYLPSDFSGDILIYDVLESTNTTAKSIAENAKENTIIIAKQQIKGRGRYGRTFYSPSQSGIYLSLILKPNTEIKDASLITCMVAVSVVRALNKLYNIDAKIKWVNDIYINNKKVCGILTEANINIETSFFDYIIVGIGINIKPPLEGYEQSIKDIATSVCENTDIPVLKNQLIGEIVSDILNNLKSFKSCDFMKEYKQHSFIIGKKVDLVSQNKTETVTILDINNSGHLVFLNQDNQVKEAFSGEISIRNIQNL